MSVTLSERAAEHVSRFLAKRGKGIGIRLGVKTSGCSGMAYKLEFADEVNSDDQVWESFGVKVIVDEKSLPYLDGTELVQVSGDRGLGDIESLLREQFLQRSLRGNPV